MIRAVLFDLDDTLLDYGLVEPQAIFHAGARRSYAFLTSRGCALPSFDQFCRRQRAAFRYEQWTTWLSGRQPDGRRAMRRLCANLGLQRDEGSLAKLAWLWYQPITQCAQVMPDVIPTLHELRDRGLKLGIVCNTSVQGLVMDRHLREAGLLEFFPVRIYSTEIGHRKPDPRTFAAALEELNVAPREAMFVGDRPDIDMAGATAVGMRTVLRQSKPTRKARKHAEYVIERISQLLEIDDLRQAQLEMEIANAGPPPPPLPTPRALVGAAR